MKNILRSLVAVLLLTAGSASAEIVQLTLTVTNASGIDTNGTSTLTVNSDTRTATNIVSSDPSKLWLGTNVLTDAATNLYRHVQIYKFGGSSPLSVRMTSTNVIVFTAIPDTAIAASLAGAWGTLTLSTNSTTNQIPVVVPAASIGSLATQTNVGSGLVEYLDKATNAIGASSVALSNYLSLGQSQTASNKTLTHSIITGGSIINVTNITGTNAALTNVTLRLVTATGADLSGFVTTLTNGTFWSNHLQYARITNGFGLHATVTELSDGVWTNATLDRPKSTNLVNYGNPISSPGTNGVNSEQFGTSARATNGQSLAVGYAAQALGTAATSIGAGSQANAGFTTALGNAAIAETESSIALGYNAYSTGTNAIAIGTDAAAPGLNSLAIGYAATVTADNEIVIGNANHIIHMPGIFDRFTATNAILRGTNTINGRVDLVSRSDTGLANGYNSGVILGTNVYIKQSGPTAGYTNVGFAASAAVDGTYHVVQAANPGLSFSLLHDSGLEATAANRIYTGTGALVNSTNNPVIYTMIYDAAVSRWRIVSFR